jgi:hypothetical protein
LQDVIKFEGAANFVYDKDMKRSIWTRLRELIGQPARLGKMISRSNSILLFRDTSTSDYTFWDAARRGRKKGLEISGLFLKPLGSKVAAWVLGMRPLYKVADEKLQNAVNGWMQRHHARIIQAYEEAVNLADCYIVINPDLSMTIISPNFVSEIVDENDFSKIIGWRIEQTIPHPDYPGTTMTYTDEYTAQTRRKVIKKNGVVISDITYRNLIGRLPVIHIPNRLGADEDFGRPEGEALIPVLQAYGNVIDAALKGNIMQGRPTPVVKNMGDAASVKEFWDAYGRTETNTLPDGTVETVPVIDLDTDRVLTLGGNAEFYYAAPGSFSSDTETLLGLLFYMILQHTEIPEFAWGNAIASSKASAESQMQPFVKWIEKKRGLAQDWLLALADVVSAYFVALQPDLRYSSPVLHWQPLSGSDGLLTLQAIEWAYEQGLIDAETALILAPLDIGDPSETIRRARQEVMNQKQGYAENDSAQGVRSTSAQAVRDRLHSRAANVSSAA